MVYLMFMRVNFRITSLFAIFVERRSVKVTCAVKCRIVFFGSFELLFGNIMFVPGPGHIELNLARLLLRFLCQAFLFHFVKCLGFRTLKAQQLVLDGVDHHRFVLKHFQKNYWCHVSVTVLKKERKLVMMDINNSLTIL